MAFALSVKYTLYFKEKEGKGKTERERGREKKKERKKGLKEEREGKLSLTFGSVD